MGQGRISHLRIEIANTQGFTQVCPSEGKDLHHAFACIDYGMVYNCGDLKRLA
jgi:hypothetical protein